MFLNCNTVVPSIVEYFASKKVMGNELKPLDYVPCTIVPPYLEKALMDNKKDKVKTYTLLHQKKNNKFRRKRCENCHGGSSASKILAKIEIYNCSRTETLPGVSYGSNLEEIEKKEFNGKQDLAAIEAYKGAVETNAFFQEIFNRQGIDNKNMDTISSVHYGFNYNNAFWTGKQMVYGDGDGEVFERFTKSIDVIAHELTHGITQYAAGLKYEEQPGALNEAMSDIFATMIKQRILGQTVTDESTDWLIGKGLFTKKMGGDNIALRSLKDPGTAYNVPGTLGKDPQVGNMHDYISLGNEKVSEDNDYGWVHLNSGIINKAFYKASMAYGGFSWGPIGKIWYQALLDSHPNTSFEEFAKKTIKLASSKESGYGIGSREYRALSIGWRETEVL